MFKHALRIPSMAMALFTPGVAVAQVSGRVGGTIFSRNRGGAYLRNGSIPSKVLTTKALLYKGYFSAASQAWAALTAAQQLAWTVWARTQSTTNRLGRSITLTGQAQFIGLSSRLLSGGDAIVVTPPVTASPLPIVPTAFTVDSGTGDTELTFADGPLDAGYKLWIKAAKVNSASINNVENLLTTVLISSAAQASPCDLESELIDAFGALQTGAYYILQVRVMDSASGLVSGKSYMRTQCVESA